MVKFSIVIPVYNVEAYIDNCLKSIENQTFDDFEVIIVNDGSPDNSQKIIDEYVKKDKRFKSYTINNSGVSFARNYGISKATGEYLIFVDSDDSINKDLLKELNKVENSDVIRYQINKIDNDREFVNKSEIFSNISGEDAFIKLINNSWFDAACASCYKREYWVDNEFSFAEGRIHEDFGIIPIAYIKARNITAIDYVGYNYYHRENSTMTSNNIQKIKKKNDDCLYHYDRLMKMINNSNVSKKGVKYFKSYISFSLINRTIIIDDKKMLEDYIAELNKREVGKYLIDDTLVRKIKKGLYNISPMLYIKFFVK